MTTRISPEEVPVTLVTTLEQARTELPKLREAVRTALDTETVILRDEDGIPLTRNLNVDAEGEGPGPWRVMSLAARMPSGEVAAWVLDMGYINGADLVEFFTGVQPFMWNAPFDRLVCRRAGLNLEAWDAMIGEAILRTGAGGGDGRHYTSLAAATRKFIGYVMDGKDSTRLDYQTVQDRPELTDDEVKYAAVDAVCTLLVAEEIGVQLREAGLMETFIRDANGQPFIAGMTNAGLPMEVEDYAARVNVEREAAAVAAERVAVATTGREMLTTIVNWADHAAAAPDVERTGDLVTDGLALMHDADVFTAFIDSVAEQATNAHLKMGELFGVAASEDLFSDADDAVFVELPLDVDNDTSVRKWVSASAPAFTAAYVLAARDEGDFDTLINQDEETLFAAAGRRRKLTKDHDVDDVLNTVVSDTRQCDETLVAVSAQLLAYRRYTRILTQYAPDSSPVEVTRLVPSWDLSSAPQAKAMLNQFAEDRVRAYMQAQGEGDRLLGTSDSVDGDALKMIGGELCDALLEYRKRSKIVSTYGDEMLKLTNKVTGRVHARYNQSLTGTGRLSSFAPNAQNLSPLVKPYVKPSKVGDVITRVLVCADLSQAELRFVADASQDIEMLTAFRSGEDLHERTAALMFGVDMKELKLNSHEPLSALVGVVSGVDSYAAAMPDRRAGSLYKELRGKAKSVAFGYAYGLKGASLARQLTVNGVPTTKEEADALLEAFDKAYPQLAAWMAARVAFINNLSENMRNMRVNSGVDFASTWLLHNTHAKAHSAFKSLTKTLGRTPTDVEIAHRLRPDLAEAIAALETVKDSADTDQVEWTEKMSQLISSRHAVAQAAAWALSHDHAVALTPEGTPWQFESRTAGGRRRLFQVMTSQLIMAVVSQIARGRRGDLVDVRDAWVFSYNERKAAEHETKREIGKARGDYKPVVLTKNGKVLDGRELEKVFEDRDMRTDFVGFALTQLPAGRMEQVWRLAMADRIRAMGNQYRNHPIQGGVADAVMVAFGDIYRELGEKYPTAWGIQSVHDSIVVECDVQDAVGVRDIVVKRMEEALAAFCPTVPCVADGDIQLSLDESTIVDESQLAELIEIAQAA